MKSTKLFIVAVVALTAQGTGIYSSNAQEFYPAFVSTVSISTNSSGGLTYHEFGNREFIRTCANEMGLTNLMGLSLVYDRANDTVDVVSGTNKTVLCTPLTFTGGTSLSNTNDTRIQRFAYVSWENSAVVNGTLVATEQQCFTTNDTLKTFSLRGQLQFAVPDNGTNSPVIYYGGIVAGSGLGFWSAFDASAK